MEFNYAFKYYKSPIEQLDGALCVLVAEAEAASEKSISPYSRFRVGAAVRLSSGRILSAANVESEVFPAGSCAERALLFYVASNFSDEKIEAIAVFSPTSDVECTPCGLCRQTLLDIERRQGGDIQIVMAAASSAIVVSSARCLLPFAFEL